MPSPTLAPLGAHNLRHLLLMLSALTALAPLGTDIYLPAVPSMASRLGVVIHDIEISISFFLLGLSLGQLLGGPLSDQFGRRKLVLTGLSIFSLATLAIIFTTSVYWLWGLRCVQALGGGLAMVNTSAIIRDISSGPAGAANLIRVMQVMMLAPLVAPVLGMLILHFSDWNMIFVFLLIYSWVLIYLFYYYLPETSPKQANKNLFKNYGVVLQESRVWGFMISVCAAYAGLLTFVTASPSIFMEYFGLSETLYPFVFGLNVLTMVLMSRVNLRLLSRFTSKQLISIGQGIQAVAGLCLLVYLLAAPVIHLWILVPCIMLFMGSHSFIVANSLACTTEYFPKQAGTATALLAALGFLSGGLAGGLAGHFADGTPLPMVSVMLVSCLLGVFMRMGVQALSKTPVAS